MLSCRPCPTTSTAQTLAKLPDQDLDCDKPQNTWYGSGTVSGCITPMLHQLFRTDFPLVVCGLGTEAIMVR